MLVEAVFWFHPLVWWMGTRLVDERERACDEAVLESGSDRQIYAESILKICEFCVGSPLTCVSGVTGAELKTRITRIMSDQVARKLDFSRKLLLATAFVLAVTAPIAAGILHANPRRTESQTQNTTPALPDHTTVSIAPSSSNGGNVTDGMGNEILFPTCARYPWRLAPYLQYTVLGSILVNAQEERIGRDYATGVEHG